MFLRSSLFFISLSIMKTVIATPSISVKKFKPKSSVFFEHNQQKSPRSIKLKIVKIMTFSLFIFSQKVTTQSKSQFLFAKLQKKPIKLAFADYEAQTFNLDLTPPFCKTLVVRSLLFFNPLSKCCRIILTGL